jgi:predicted RNA-binding Zn ribbon-like protein
MTTNPNPFFARGFGASASWLDLVNSELWDGFGNFTECLDDPRWLRAFLRYWKLRIPAKNPAALKALRELRALLRHLVETNSAQGSLSRDDLAKLNDWLKVPVYPTLVESQSGFALALRPAQIGWQSEVASIARGFADSLLHQAKGHLKICANDDCRWIFVDRSKGNVRRWCSDATCGNRDRVRRARAAQAKHKIQQIR